MWHVALWCRRRKKKAPARGSFHLLLARGMTNSMPISRRIIVASKLYLLLKKYFGTARLLVGRWRQPRSQSSVPRFLSSSRPVVGATPWTGWVKMAQFPKSAGTLPSCLNWSWFYSSTENWSEVVVGFILLEWLWADRLPSSSARQVLRLGCCVAQNSRSWPLHQAMHLICSRFTDFDSIRLERLLLRRFIVSGWCLCEMMRLNAQDEPAVPQIPLSLSPERQLIFSI